MLGDISGVEKIYIVCGYTDMRKSIDGLCAVIEDQLELYRAFIEAGAIKATSPEAAQR